MYFVGLQGPVIEKDPNIEALKQSVANKMWDIIKSDVEASEKLNDITFVSFEDALKELAALKTL
jgi:hypothetical protein